MSRTVTVAATQMACSWDREANIANAEKLVREAAAKARGAGPVALNNVPGARTGKRSGGGGVARGKDISRAPRRGLFKNGPKVK